MNFLVNKRTRCIVLFLGIITLFSSTGFLAANAAFTISDKIYDGILVGDIPVGGLSIDEAQNKIRDNFKKQITSPPIYLTYKTKKWPIEAKDIDLDIDAAKLAQQAYNVGRVGNLMNRVQERYCTIHYGNTIPLALLYNQAKLQDVIKSIADAVHSNPQSSLVLYQNSKISILPEKTGYNVDLEKTLAALSTSIKTKIPATLELVVNELPPPILSQDLSGIDSLLSVYTTQFDAHNENRSKNISIATKNINNILVRPGEIFSFNQYVGERLSEYGYQEAPVFIDGKLVLDWGGGVCQVSSTLYNAALLADMDIVERTSHFHPPSYVPLGRDAAVADNLLDFKFKNTSGNNIYISSEASNNEITIYIFGKTNPALTGIQIIGANQKVIDPTTVFKEDPNLELGKQVVESEGQKGFEVTTYRVKVTDGHGSTQELLAYDEFQAEDKIIRIGTKILSK